MIKISINRKKVDPQFLVHGKNGNCYLDAVLMPNRDGQDQYGNDGFIVQTVPKEKYQQGIKGPIIGNYRDGNTQHRQKPPQSQSSSSEYDF